MKNKEVKIMIAILAVSIAAVTGMGRLSMEAVAKGKTQPVAMQPVETSFIQLAINNAEQLKEKEKTISSKSSKEAVSKGVSKEETVYVKMDGSGKITSVIVSDQLKNLSGLGEIEDISNLLNIENVKGNEEFTKNDKQLIWKNENQDICYQGTTQQKLPVGVKIDYQLDGKTITEKELEGKSGHLVIRYSYENTSQETEKEFVPFAMVTGIILDTEHFTNVTVTNGKVISDGDREIAVGIGFPGLKENLEQEKKGIEQENKVNKENNKDSKGNKNNQNSLADFNIPDYFEIEADVTEYKSVIGMTLATNELFNEIDADQFDSVDDIKEAMQELQDASDKLVDGSGQLKDGLGTLLDSSDTLIHGITELTDGGKKLSDGTNSLSKGVSTLSNGANDLAKGTSDLANGSSSLASGSAALASGTSQLADGVKTLQGGANQVAEGLDSAAKQTSGALKTGAAALSQNLENMQAQASQLSDGVAVLNQNMKEDGTIMQGAAGLAAGTQEISNSLSMLSQMFRQSIAGNEGIDAVNAAEEPEASCDDAIAILQQVANDVSGNDACVGQIQTAIQQLQQYQALQAAKENQQISPQEIAGMLDALAAASNQVASGASDLKNGLTQVSQGIGQMNQQVNGQEITLKGGVEQLAQGAGALSGGIDQLSTGLEQLAAGAKQVSAGSDTLSEKVGELNAGAQSVAGGASQLEKGAYQAASGASQLSGGALELVNGVKELDNGAGSLYQGLSTLQNGSGALTDGVKKLDNGADELNKGMIQFREEGIDELTKVLEEDIDGFLERFRKILDSSKSYKNFSGITDGMDGKVKFIFINEEAE